MKLRVILTLLHVALVTLGAEERASFALTKSPFKQEQTQ